VLALLALALVLLPPFTWPVLAPTSSGFFWRFAPKALLPFSLEFHDGLDLAVPLGTRVRPAAPGIVAATGSDAVSGRWVRLRHLGGFESFYAHLERLDTSPGRLILLPGFSSLGRSGSSGRSTGPHLHFELRFLGRSLPPGILLAPHRLRLLLLGF
jgi:murein DD-endopeptidase MepM/ murein hydrolase activator NlpD